MNAQGEHKLPFPRLVLPLTAIVLGAALLLSLIHALGGDRIVAQQLATGRAALDEVLPATRHDNDLLASGFDLDPRADDFVQMALLGLDVTSTGYRATLRGELSGVILPAVTRGFNGSISLLIGIDSEGTITGVRAVQHGETRDLGDAIDTENSPWIRGFNNRSLENTPQVLWQVKKDGGDFDQFVGATITPRAVVAAIHDALLFFDHNRDRLLAIPAEVTERR